MITPRDAIDQEISVGSLVMVSRKGSSLQGNRIFLVPGIVQGIEKLPNPRDFKISIMSYHGQDIVSNHFHNGRILTDDLELSTLTYTELKNIVVIDPASVEQSPLVNRLLVENNYYYSYR